MNVIFKNLIWTKKANYILIFLLKFTSFILMKQLDPSATNDI